MDITPLTKKQAITRKTPDAPIDSYQDGEQNQRSTVENTVV